MTAFLFFISVVLSCFLAMISAAGFSFLAAKKRKDVYIYTRSALAGAFLLLCFYEYFGATDWIFSSNYGSEKGGILALVMFLLGALLFNEISKDFFPTIKNLPMEMRRKNALIMGIIACCLYTFISGLKLDISQAEYLRGVVLTQFFDCFVLAFFIFTQMICYHFSKREVFISIITILVSVGTGTAIALLTSNEMPKEVFISCVAAAICGSLLCGTLYQWRGKKSFISLLFGFSVMLILKLVG